jgi:hypothetical protein
MREELKAYFVEEGVADQILVPNDEEKKLVSDINSAVKR